MTLRFHWVWPDKEKWSPVNYISFVISLVISFSNCDMMSHSMNASLSWSLGGSAALVCFNISILWLMMHFCGVILLWMWFWTWILKFLKRRTLDLQKGHIQTWRVCVKRCLYRKWFQIEVQVLLILLKQILQFTLFPGSGGDVTEFSLPDWSSDVVIIILFRCWRISRRWAKGGIISFKWSTTIPELVSRSKFLSVNKFSKIEKPLSYNNKSKSC